MSPSDQQQTCPICDRPLVPGPSVDAHHWVPKSEGGTETAVLHRVCHRMLHRLFTERELATLYDTPERLRDHPDVAKFIKWVRKKPADFVDWPKRPRK